MEEMSIWGMWRNLQKGIGVKLGKWHRGNRGKGRGRASKSKKLTMKIQKKKTQIPTQGIDVFPSN